MSKVVVFSSNAAGIHNTGAAEEAYKKHGARWKAGYGHYGNSFAIPTSDANMRTLSLSTIKAYADGFKAYAADHPELTFQVTQFDVPGHQDKDIASLFLGSSLNMQFDSAWKSFLGAEFTYWNSRDF